MKKNDLLINLDLDIKQTIVDLLMAVQSGEISCRLAATEIEDAHDLMPWERDDEEG